MREYTAIILVRKYDSKQAYSSWQEVRKEYKVQAESFTDALNLSIETCKKDLASQEARHQLINVIDLF